jgi:hypothetical protein
MRALGTLLALAMAASLSTVSAAEPARAKALPGKRVDDAALARQRGGTDASTGLVSGNQATNVVTGNNTITGGALAGASGVPVVIQNSGNNVLIQSSVTVNVQMK